MRFRLEIKRRCLTWSYSGKSTLVLCLLGLLEVDTGSISVDGIDLCRLPRSAIIDRCFIAIPQDPIMAADETLRYNIDPEGVFTDDQVISALKTTALWNPLSRADRAKRSPKENQESSKILLQKLATVPTLTPGRLQLLALSRAVLRQRGHSADTSPCVAKPILLLDEATSSLDDETEALFYKVIKDCFTDQGHTVIMISHRVGAAQSGLRKGIDVSIEMGGGTIQSITSA